MRLPVAGILVVVLLAGLVLPAPPAASASWFDTKLRTWDWEGPLEDKHIFKLAPGEAHDTYFFGLQAVSGDAFAHIEVLHAGTGDARCHTVIWVYNGVPKYLECDELQVGHTYLVSVRMIGDADTVLWGVNR